MQCMLTILVAIVQYENSHSQCPFKIFVVDEKIPLKIFVPVLAYALKS